MVVIEDNAHGLFGHHRGEPLGGLGRFASLSFHETKNFVCGEGGALLLDDPADVDRARILYDKGTNRQAFLLGHVDKYSWRDTGSSFGLSDVLAAYLLGQLEQAASDPGHGAVASSSATPRRSPHRRPGSACGSRWSRRGATRRTTCSTCCCPTPPMRDAVLERLREQGIGATFHYVPLHNSQGGRRFAAAHRVPGHRATSAPGSSGCRSTTPSPSAETDRVPPRRSSPPCGSTREPR